VGTLGQKTECACKTWHDAPPLRFGSLCPACGGTTVQCLIQQEQLSAYVPKNQRALGSSGSESDSEALEPRRASA